MKRIYTLGLCLAASLLFMLSCRQGSTDGQKSLRKEAVDSLVDQVYERYDAFDYAGCVELGEEALQQCQELGDTITMSDLMSTMCIAYLRVGDVAKGLETASRAIEIDSILGDPELLSGDYNTVAGLYLSEEKAAEAEPFILKSIEYEMKTPDRSHLSNRYGIASEVYCKMHQPELALDYAHKGLAIAVEQGDSAQIGTRLSQLGDAYMASGQMAEAERTFLNCAEMLVATQSAPVSLAIVYRQLGNIYEDRNSIPQAIAYYEKAANLARQLQYTLLLCQCTQAIGELTAGQHPDYSVQMLMESRALADTLHSQKVEELMADFATKFDLKEKQHTIEEQAAELRLHRILTSVFFGMTFISVLIFILIFYLKKLSRKSEKLEVKLSEKVVQETQHSEPEMNEADRDFINRLSQYVEQHLEEKELSSTTMAGEFCLSPRQFSRRVKDLTGVDTTHFIRASRIQRARHLLAQTELTISEICMQCGFDSPNYFSRTFRSDVGLSPTEYRRKSKENP